MKHFYSLSFRSDFLLLGILEYLLQHKYFICLSVCLFLGTVFSQEARAWIAQQDGADSQSCRVINERSEKPPGGVHGNE